VYASTDPRNQTTFFDARIQTHSTTQTAREAVRHTQAGWHRGSHKGDVLEGSSTRLLHHENGNIHRTGKTMNQYQATTARSVLIQIKRGLLAKKDRMEAEKKELEATENRLKAEIFTIDAFMEIERQSS
jgi:hypothetical protein